MAIALVTNGQGATGLDPTTTSSLNTTGATLLVAVVTYAGTPTGVSDSKGNTWTALTAYANSGVTSRIYYVNSNTPTVGTGHTFSINGGTATAINVMAFSGTDVTPYDSLETGSNSASAATIQPGSVTPTQNSALIITGFSGGNTFGGAATINLGFNITNQKALTGGVNYGTAAAYLIQTLSSATNPTWTLGSTVSNIASSIAVFQAAPVTVFKTAQVNASSVPATATNFPSYVDLSRLGITTLAEAQSVRVYAESTKTTEWAREIVSATEMHVKVPSLTSTTSMYVEWDGVRADYAATDTYGRNAVWSAVQASYRLEGLTDSKSGTYDLTNDNTIVFDAGKIGNAASAGTNSGTPYKCLSRSDTMGIGSDSAFVFSAWIYFNSLTFPQYGQGGIFTRSTNGGRFQGVYATPTGLTSYQDSSSGSVATASFTWVVSTWYKIVYSFDGTTYRTYIDNSLLITHTPGTRVTQPTTFTSFLAVKQSPINSPFPGKIDNLIMASSLSADWNTVEYNNQSDEAGFWGTWSTVGGTFTPHVVSMV